jgi:hypothetical protein
MKNKGLWIIGIFLITVGLLSSCQAWEDELGKDLLPPSDKVFLFHDTVFDIHAYPVTGMRMVTSDRSLSNATLFLLGYLNDTIVGSSRASIFTQFNSTSTYIPGPNTEIDTVLLFLYIPDYLGNTEAEMTIRVHEATERLYMDTLYYSDYVAEGKYNPDFLAEKSIMPLDNDTVQIQIEDPAFIQKFLDVQNDSALFRNDSAFKDYFKGFYLTAFSSAPEGTMAKVGLSNVVSRLLVRYANDSTEVDSTAGKDFTWASFSINEYYCQKISVFENDHSNTYLSEIIDRDSIETPYCYVQGMAGVNTRLSFTNMKQWMDQEQVAINSATLIFDVVPEELSGIKVENLPQRLMLFTEQDNGNLENLYDYIAVSKVDDKLFGGVLNPVSRGMFYDTTYTYQFNMGLHFQSMIDGVAPDYNFRLELYDAVRNPKITKLWSNLSANPKRIRLEVVYLKL